MDLMGTQWTMHLTTCIYLYVFIWQPSLETALWSSGTKSVTNVSNGCCEPYKGLLEGTFSPSFGESPSPTMGFSSLQWPFSRQRLRHSMSGQRSDTEFIIWWSYMELYGRAELHHPVPSHLHWTSFTDPWTQHRHPYSLGTTNVCLKCSWPNSGEWQNSIICLLYLCVNAYSIVNLVLPTSLRKSSKLAMAYQNNKNYIGAIFPPS